MRHDVGQRPGCMLVLIPSTLWPLSSMLSAIDTILTFKMFISEHNVCESKFKLQMQVKELDPRMYPPNLNLTHHQITEPKSIS